MYCFYSIPGKSRDNYNSFLFTLDELLQFVIVKDKTINIVLAGDFNIDFIDECNGTVRDIIQLFTSFGARTTVHEPTRRGNQGSNGTCIDNVVTTIGEDFCSARVVPALVSDHDPICFTTNIGYIDQSKKLPSNSFIPKRSINEFNLYCFLFILRQLNWLFV